MSRWVGAVTYGEEEEGDEVEALVALAILWYPVGGQTEIARG